MGSPDRKFNQPRLESGYYDGTRLGGPWRVPSADTLPIPQVDPKKLENREKILQIKRQRLSEFPLAEKFKPGDKDVDLALVLREGLLGFLSDDVLIADILPSGEGKQPTDVIFLDPLWSDIAGVLPKQKINQLLRIVTNVAKVSEKLEDPLQSASVRNAIGRGHLQSIGDLRSVDEMHWKRVSGVGDIGAAVLFNASKMLE